MLFRKFCCATLLFLACSSVAQAGLTIAVGSLTLTGGNSGYVAVRISGTGEMVGVTEFELQISPTVVGEQPIIEFETSPAPASDMTFDAGSNYIFDNSNSFDFASPNPLGTASSSGSNGTNDLFFGLDFANTGGVSVSATQMLLADVPVTTLGSLVGTPDTYLISLVPSSTSFSNMNQDTHYDITSSTSGIVTVVPASNSPVPEPGTFGLLLSGMTGLLWMKRKRASVDHMQRNS